MAVTGKAFTHPGDWVATILGDAVFFTLAATLGFFVTLQYERARLRDYWNEMKCFHILVYTSIYKMKWNGGYVYL